MCNTVLYETFYCLVPQSPYALLLAASTLTKLVTKNNSTISIQDRLQLSKQAMNISSFLLLLLLLLILSLFHCLSCSICTHIYTFLLLLLSSYMSGTATTFPGTSLVSQDTWDCPVVPLVMVTVYISWIQEPML